MTSNETVMILSMGVRIVFAFWLLTHVITKQILALTRSKNCVRKTKKLLLIGTLSYVASIFFAYPIFEELVQLEGDVPQRIMVFSILRTVCVITTSIAFIQLYGTTEKPHEDRMGFGGKQQPKEE